MLRRIALPTTVLLGSILAVTIALAADDGNDAGTLKVNTERTSGLPRGPEVNFCPSPQQARDHLEEFGFDYKPTVPCTASGEVIEGPPPDPEEVDHDRGLSNSEAAKTERQRLLAARPTEHDGNPCTIDGEYQNGKPISVMFFACPGEEVTPAGFARGVFK